MFVPCLSDRRLGDDVVLSIPQLQLRFAVGFFCFKLLFFNRLIEYCTRNFKGQESVKQVSRWYFIGLFVDISLSLVESKSDCSSRTFCLSRRNRTEDLAIILDNIFDILQTEQYGVKSDVLLLYWSGSASYITICSVYRIWSKKILRSTVLATVATRYSSRARSYSALVRTW